MAKKKEDKAAAATDEAARRRKLEKQDEPAAESDGPEEAGGDTVRNPMDAGSSDDEASDSEPAPAPTPGPEREPEPEPEPKPELEPEPESVPVPAAPAQLGPDQKWCKKCKCAFPWKEKGDVCSQGHPNFMYLKRIPAAGGVKPQVDSRSQPKEVTKRVSKWGDPVAKKMGDNVGTLPAADSEGIDARIARQKREKYEASDEYKQQVQKQKEEQESISLSAASQLSEADISKEKDAVAAAGEIKVKRWIEDVTGKQLDGKLAEELRSGEVLCELANAIRPQSIDKISRSPKPFDQRENITKFIAAARAFGVLDRENFDTNDLYDGSGIRQVLICLNALGRVSATVQGFNGPPLSVSAADRTGSVNQSGKVRSLGDTLKDKISLAPQKLEPGSVEFMQQQQREKAHRERKALEKAKQEFSVGVHPTKARAQRQPKKVGRRRSSGRKLNPAVVAVAEEAKRELRAKAEFEAKESAAAIVRQQALAEKEFNADVKRLQQFHPPFNAKPAATMDMLDQVKFKQDQMKAKAAWEAAHESAGTEEVPDIIAAGLVKLRDAHAEHEAKAAAEAEANARVMEKKRQAQVAAKAEKDRLAKEDRQKTAAENKAKREAAQRRAAADSEAQEQSRSELQAKMKSNARTSTTQLDEAAAESKALTKAEVKAQTKELMRLVKTAKESEQANEISVALKQYEEALSNAQAISARDRPSKKKLVSTVKLLVAKTCDLQALMQNHAEETSTPPMQASRSEVEANDTDENSDGEEAEPEPEPEPEPAGGNSKLVMNAAALLDSDDDEAELEPEPEPAGGNSKLVMNAAALLDSDDDEAEPEPEPEQEPEPEPAGGNSKLVMNAAALLDSDLYMVEQEPVQEQAGGS